MSEKRIQRKHFLAAMGAAVVGAIGGQKLVARSGSVKHSAVAAATHEGRPLSTDPRAVARSTDSRVLSV